MNALEHLLKISASNRETKSTDRWTDGQIDRTEILGTINDEKYTCIESWMFLMGSVRNFNQIHREISRI